MSSDWRIRHILAVSSYSSFYHLIHLPFGQRNFTQVMDVIYFSIVRIVQMNTQPTKKSLAVDNVDNVKMLKGICLYPAYWRLDFFHPVFSLVGVVYCIYNRNCSSHIDKIQMGFIQIERICSIYTNEMWSDYKSIAFDRFAHNWMFAYASTYRMCRSSSINIPNVSYAMHGTTRSNSIKRCKLKIKIKTTIVIRHQRNNKRRSLNEKHEMSIANNTTYHLSHCSITFSWRCHFECKIKVKLHSRWQQTGLYTLTFAFRFRFFSAFYIQFFNKMPWLWI